MTVPQHVGIIMDGNRRWARSRDLPIVEGHRAGTSTLHESVATSIELGVQYLTVYAFSTENWRRAPQEVADLVKVFMRGLDEYVQPMVKQGVAMRFIGNPERFPSTLQRRLREAQDATASGGRLTLNVALGYGGREEILRSVQRLADSGALCERLEEADVSDHLDTAGQPDPDLVIRTGGMVRLSNFLTWQTVYSELHFTDTLWPDFTPEEYRRILDSYSEAQRNFGT